MLEMWPNSPMPLHTEQKETKIGLISQSVSGQHWGGISVILTVLTPLNYLKFQSSLGPFVPLLF